jgi:DNA-binding response OmpR family regulator
MSSQQKVLIIDDSAVALEWARVQLEAAGYLVVVRDEPLGSSLLVIRERPDLVLIDVNMPSLSGDELVALLKGHTRLHSARLVLYSAKAESELVKLTASSGADGYICKTSDPRLFIAKVRAALDSGAE